MKILIRKKRGGKISLLPVKSDIKKKNDKDILLEEKHLLYIYKLYNTQESIVTSLEEIADYICFTFKMSFSEMKGRCRKQKYVAARQCYCFTAWLMNIYSLSEIGEYINRDHATVCYARRQCLTAIDLKDEVLYNPLVEILTHFNMWDIERNKLKIKKQLEDE